MVDPLGKICRIQSPNHAKVHGPGKVTGVVCSECIDNTALLERSAFESPPPLSTSLSPHIFETRYIVNMAFSGCGQRLVIVTGDNRHSVYVYEWRTKKIIHQDTGHNGQPPQVRATPG